MASSARRLPTNVPGDFFVDQTCIDCDTCRWMAPETFDRAEEQSRVHRQPGAPAEIERAFDLDEQLKHVDEIFHRVFEDRPEVVGAGFNRPVGR